MALSMGLLGGAAYRNGDFELISTALLGSSAASVTFTGLDANAAGYKHLQLRATMRTDYATSYANLYAKLNNDTVAANYSYHELFGLGSSVTSTGYGSSYPPTVTYIPGSTVTSGSFNTSIIDIVDFSSSVKSKTIKTLSGIGGSIIESSSVAWHSTSALTAIELRPVFGNFIIGCRFSLYGIRG